MYSTAVRHLAGKTLVATCLVFRLSLISSCGLALCIFLASCSSQPFTAQPPASSAFISRAITQTLNGVVVSTAVPDATETQKLIGLDLYASNIQPVWLQIENNTDKAIRIAHSSIDDEYYSPMEVAWKYRNQFSSVGRANMERWFYENQLPRRIEPGTTSSGFIYTHLATGTKGFNIDLYSSQQSYTFTFFVPLPGFKADYMDVNFQTLYRDDERQPLSIEDLQSAIANYDCCSTDETGKGIGDPFNVVLVGTPAAVRRSLLRANWQETAENDPETKLARTHRHRLRPPDGTFHKARPDGSERKEVRLWLSPLRVDDQSVWIGQVSYDMSGATGLKAFEDYQIDPDIDDARMFLLQNFWYSQSLAKLGVTRGVPPANFDAPVENFSGSNYFTDGRRAVLFLSEQPIAMDETQVLEWESLPFHNKPAQ